MRFSIPKVQDYQKYLDLAFRNAKERYELVRRTLKLEDKLKKSKILVKERIKTINKVLKKQLNLILEKFPYVNNLNEFYVELMKCYFSIKDYKKALSSVKWVIEKINELSEKTLKELYSINDKKEINKKRNEYYGRVSSFMKRIKDSLEFLENVRKIIIKFPDIKKLFTVVITGFPNVGKSTLLKKLTNSNVKIASYPFTTKQILIGYFQHRLDMIQVIDIPGTLNRNKKNNIEKIADIAIKYLPHLIIYIFDLTEPYPLKQQLQLYSKILKLNKKTIVYFSKTDIIEKEKIEKFIEGYGITGFSNLEDLKNAIIKEKDRFKTENKEEYLNMINL